MCKILEKNMPSDNDSRIIKFCILISAILCIMAMTLINKTQTMHGIAFPIAGFALVICFAIYLFINHKLSTRNIIILLFALGFILRLNYIAYTTLTPDSFLRQHDLHTFGGDEGHSAYIEFFYNNGIKLPNFDPTTKKQFYHPPLHHFVAAVFMRILTFSGMSYSRAVGSIQFLTLFYSTCCMIVSERIFDILNIKKLGKIIAVAIVAFHPSFIILSGSINNDILSILFILLSIYATIKWYKNPSVKTILPIAIFIGLGMSTKLSVSLVAIPVSFVFIIKIINIIKNQKKKVFRYIKQFTIFGVVCVPLGMWFYLRNYIKYNVPFGYVLQLSNNSPQYIGSKNFFERIFDLSYNPFGNVFLNKPVKGIGYYEYNLFAALLKTSIFGEYNYSNIQMIMPFCQALSAVNIILVLLSVFATVYFLVIKSSFLDRTMKIFIGSFQLIMLINYIIFAFQYPHTCSMDYRYIIPTLVIGALFIGAFVERFKAVKAVKTSAIVLTSLFCVLSACVYVILGIS